MKGANPAGGEKMDEVKCVDCSFALLCRDGALRCEFDNRLAINPCARHEIGKFRIAGGYKLKESPPKAIVSKVRAPAPKLRKGNKPTQQGRMF